MKLPNRLALLTIHLRAAVDRDRGASTVETVIIVAALAALAIAALAAITTLVDAKVGGIHL
jgi:hypothetical protein